MKKKQSDLRLHSHLVEFLNDDVARKQHQEYFQSPTCKAFRELLIKYLEDYILRSVTKSDGSATFDKLAWPEYQAHQAGGREEARHIIRLLKGTDHA